MAKMHCGHPNTAVVVNEWTGERYCASCRAENRPAADPAATLTEAREVLAHVEGARKRVQAALSHPGRVLGMLDRDLLEQAEECLREAAAQIKARLPE
jgi:hypothetical protein